jgi:DNA-binding transcriptional regulator YdaS (Cro superfamily)
MAATIEAAIGRAALRQAIDWAYAPSPAASYQLAFNRLDIMSFHELQGVVDEDIDRG